MAKLFIIFFVLSYSALSFSQETKSSLTTDNKEESNPNPIDWSKPVVSRGFGLEKKASSEEPVEWINQYKSGQVFYFFGSYAQAAKKWQPLAAQNYAEAQASLAWLYQAGLGVSKDLQKAYVLYQAAAKQGNAVAQNNLGVMYEQGLFVEKNVTLASRWYKASAEQGYRFAQYNYGNMLLADSSNKLHKVEAIKWYQKAAEQNVKQAIAKLKLLKVE